MTKRELAEAILIGLAHLPGSNFNGDAAASRVTLALELAEQMKQAAEALAKRDATWA